MRIIQSEIIALAAKPAQYPPGDLPEIAFAGRSNVGKSSLLNYLCGRRQLARVSGNPGKTRTINFYLINGSFRFVDLPGYGYAKASKQITAGWDEMMAAFFESRKNLKGVVQLVDIRHEPTALDAAMHEYLKGFGLEGLLCATKADKVSGNERQNNIARIRRRLALAPEERVIPVSSFKKTGGDVLLEEIGRLCQA